MELRVSDTEGSLTDTVTLWTTEVAVDVIWMVAVEVPKPFAGAEYWMAIVAMPYALNVPVAGIDSQLAAVPE